MVKFAIITTLCSLGLCTAALAACPTSVPGTTNEAIRANEQRVLCLQQEVDERARLRQFDMQLRANQRDIQTLQLQRRFDTIRPAITPSPFARPSPFVPN